MVNFCDIAIHYAYEEVTMTIKNMLKCRATSLLLCVLLVCTMVMQASATSISGSASIINWIALDYDWSKSESDGSGNVTASDVGDGTAKLTVTAKGYKQLLWHRTSTTTLTITNPSTELDVYVYLYEQSHSSNAATVNGSTVPTSETKYTIAKGGGNNLKIALKSTASTTNENSVIVITKIELEEKSYTTQFNTYAGGSYAISGGKDDGVDKTPGNSYSKTTTEAPYTLTAEADKGYKFAFWVSANNGMLSRSATYEYNPTENDTIYPVFYEEDAAVYQIVEDNSFYQYFDEAMTAATTTDGTAKTVRLMAGGNVKGKTGGTDFEIPTNVSFVIPYGDGDAGNFTSRVECKTSGSVSGAYSNGTLTLPENSSITLEGKMSINAVHREIDANMSGRVAGYYGHLILEDGSDLTVADDGILYCYGHVTGGGGSVTAQPGAIIYEPIQIGDWRGGSRMTAWLGLGSGTGKNPLGFSQYYVQNIETTMTVHTGATVYASGTVVMNSGETPFSAEFIGANGMLSVSDGRLVLNYDPYEDRTTYELYGTGTLGKMVINMAGENVDTSNYVVPLNSNMSIVIKENSNFSVLYDVKLLPDVEVIIEESADVTVKGNMYLYGVKAWTDGAYADGNDYVHVGYIATTGAASTRTVTATESSSALLQVDGTLTVENTGGLYTSGTAGEAEKNDIDKVIWGKGTIINDSTNANTEIYELENNNNGLLGSASVANVSFPVQPAVGRLAGKSTSDADYANFGIGEYSGLGEEFDHYWYQKEIPVTGEVSQLVSKQGCVVKENDDNSATAYSVAGGTVRLALNNGYAAYQNDAVLTSTVDSGSVAAVYTTTDLDTEIVIGEAGMVSVTVNMVCDGEIVKTLTVDVVPGTMMSGYYTDQTCSNAAGSVNGGEVLYASAQAWVEWANGSADSYYRTLDEAMTVSTNDADAVHLLGDIQIDTPYVISNDRDLVFYLDGNTITYNSTLFDIYGKLRLDLEGGKIINYHKPVDELTPTTTTTTDDEGNQVTTTTYDTAAAEVCALVTRSGGVLELNVNGGSLGWAVPESYITEYGYVFSSTAYVTPLYNNAGGMMNVDLSSGEIFVDHPGVLLYSKETYELDAISNRGSMNITGNGDGKGVIWSSAYSDGESYANSNGTTCIVTVAIHNYGTSGNLTLDGVTVNSTNENASSIATIYSYHGATVTLRNTTINALKGYAVMSRGGTITEVTDCTINCLNGIHSRDNNTYSASIDAISGDTTINASGSYGVYSRGNIGAIGGENSNVSITGLYYGVYLYSDYKIDTIGGKNATVTISQTSAGASSKLYSPVYVGVGASVGTIGVDESVKDNTKTSVTLTGTAYYGLLLEEESKVTTIGGENADVTISAALYGVYVSADSTVDLIGGKNATIAISQSTVGASSKYYAPIRIATGGHIGTIGVDQLDTDNTLTTITLTASAYYGIYAAGDGENNSIDTIGGPKANVTISAPRYAIYLTTNGSIGTIGVGNDTVTLKSTGNAYYNMHLVSSASVDTIGGSGSVVNFTAAGTGSKNRHNLYVVGTIGTIGGAGSTVNFTGARGYSGAGYGIRVEGSIGVIGDAGSTITLSGTSRNTTYYYRGIQVTSGGTITQIGSGAAGDRKAATITITDAASSKGGYGIWASTGTIGSIGNGADITIKAYNGIAAGYTNPGISGRIDTIGSDAGSIKITASNNGLYTMRSYVKDGTEPNVGTIGVVKGKVQVVSSKYALYNSGVIEELKDNVILATTGTTAYYTVFNAEESTVTVSETITNDDGTETTQEVTYPVSAGEIRLVSGGDYYHASGRDYIFSNGAENITYPDGYGLSKITREVTLADGKTKYNCYYIALKASAGTATGEEEPVEIGTLAQAIEAYFSMDDNSDTYVILTDDCIEAGSITLTDDLYIDLSGYDLDISGFDIDYGEDDNGNAYNLYIIDSGTNAYLQNTNDRVGGVILGDNTVSNTKVFTVKRGASNGKHYVQLEGENGIEFHRAGVSVTTIQYTPGQNYAVFQGVFRGTDDVIDVLEDLGFRFNEKTDVWYGLSESDAVSYDMAFSYARKFADIESVQALLSFDADHTAGNVAISILRDGIADLIKEASE